jgi:hypothetical protein
MRPTPRYLHKSRTLRATLLDYSLCTKNSDARLEKRTILREKRKKKIEEKEEEEEETGAEERERETLRGCKRRGGTSAARTRVPDNR